MIWVERVRKTYEASGSMSLQGLEVQGLGILDLPE